MSQHTHLCQLDKRPQQSTARRCGTPLGWCIQRGRTRSAPCPCWQRRSRRDRCGRGLRDDDHLGRFKTAPGMQVVAEHLLQRCASAAGDSHSCQTGRLSAGCYKALDTDQNMSMAAPCCHRSRDRKPTWLVCMQQSQKDTCQAHIAPFKPHIESPDLPPKPL